MCWIAASAMSFNVQTPCSRSDRSIASRAPSRGGGPGMTGRSTFALAKRSRSGKLHLALEPSQAPDRVHPHPHLVNERLLLSGFRVADDGKLERVKAADHTRRGAGGCR